MNSTDHEVAPGEIWIHVGGEGIRGTGLRVQIIELTEDQFGRPGFTANYPDIENRKRRNAPRQYRGASLGRYYQRESS